MRELRYATRRGYDQIIRLHLVPHLGKIKLAELGPDDAETMLAAMKEQGLPPAPGSMPTPCCRLLSAPLSETARCTAMWRPSLTLHRYGGSR